MEDEQREVTVAVRRFNEIAPRESTVAERVVAERVAADDLRRSMEIQMARVLEARARLRGRLVDL